MQFPSQVPDHPVNRSKKKRRPITPEVESHVLDRVTLGRRLRAARKQFGWTLAQLSARSGVSITTISRAERGQLALGYENFAALGQALQMDMGSMFSGAGVVYRGLSFSYEFLGTRAVGKQMNPVRGTVHARAVNGPEDYARHSGEEFVYVLSGVIEVHFDDGNKVRLARGDSLYFDSRIGHAYISVSRQLAKVIGVITSESSHMRSARAGETD